MPLNIIKLQKDLLDFFKNNNRTPVETAKDLAIIIDSYVRSATVISQGTGTAPPGIPTAGSPAAQVTVAPVISAINTSGKLI